MVNDRTLDHVARLRQVPIWIGLAAIVVLSWLYLFQMNASMPGMTTPMSGLTSQMPGMTSSMSGMTPAKTASMIGSASVEILLIFVMWSVMMVAMMVPTTVPAITLFLTLTGRRHPSQNPTVPTAHYVGGYIAAWIGYSAFAAFAQWVLTRTMLVSPMRGSNATVGALILLVAGVYQFTPLKDACLTQCRSPLAFFMAEWRDGNRGAFVLGLRQGAYCVTCCWMLMAVMFVVGVMNLTAMALLTVFLLAEKMAPPAWHISRVSGAALIAWGAWIGASMWP